MMLVSRSLMLVLVLWLTVNDGGYCGCLNVDVGGARRCRWCSSMPVVPVDAGCVRRCRWCPSMPVVPVVAGARRCWCCPSMPVVPRCPVVLCSWSTRV
ncbi:hypothetical protein Hanom_Chr14g01325091 [Helianthus anomalus]